MHDGVDEPRARDLFRRGELTKRPDPFWLSGHVMARAKWRPAGNSARFWRKVGDDPFLPKKKVKIDPREGQRTVYASGRFVRMEEGRRGRRIHSPLGESTSASTGKPIDIPKSAPPPPTPQRYAGPVRAKMSAADVAAKKRAELAELAEKGKEVEVAEPVERPALPPPPRGVPRSGRLRPQPRRRSRKPVLVDRAAPDEPATEEEAAPAAEPAAPSTPASGAEAPPRPPLPKPAAPAPAPSKPMSMDDLFGGGPQEGRVRIGRAKKKPAAPTEDD